MQAARAASASGSEKHPPPQQNQQVPPTRPRDTAPPKKPRVSIATPRQLQAMKNTNASPLRNESNTRTSSRPPVSPPKTASQQILTPPKTPPSPPTPPSQQTQHPSDSMHHILPPPSSLVMNNHHAQAQPQAHTLPHSTTPPHPQAYTQPLGHSHDYGNSHTGRHTQAPAPAPPHPPHTSFQRNNSNNNDVRFRPPNVVNTHRAGPNRAPLRSMALPHSSPVPPAPPSQLPVPVGMQVQMQATGTMSIPVPVPVSSAFPHGQGHQTQGQVANGLGRSHSSVISPRHVPVSQAALPPPPPPVPSRNSVGSVSAAYTAAGYTGASGNTPMSIQQLPPIRTVHAQAAHERPVAPSTFQGLVQKILSHSVLPVLVGELHETVTGHSLVITDARCESSIRSAGEQSRRVDELARTRGLDAACSSNDALDVFMAALRAAVVALRQPAPPPVPQPLHAALTAAGSSANNSGTLSGTNSSSPSINGNGNGNAMNEPPGRAKIPERAKQILEKWFDEHFEAPYPKEHEKRKLAQQTGLRMNQINNYFGNRRMRTKRKRLEQDGAAAARSGTLPYARSVLAPRTKWRAIVRPGTAQRENENPVRTPGHHNPNDRHSALTTALFHGGDDDEAYSNNEPSRSAAQYVL